MNLYATKNLCDNLYKKETDNVYCTSLTAKGWDTALKFIETVGDDKDETYPMDSTGKGWYSDNKENNSEQETGKSVDITNATTPNKLKNIYDMAGNVEEWTSVRYYDNLPSYSHYARRRKLQSYSN